MNQEQIELAIRMVSGGRVQHPAVVELCEALAKILASPEERLAMSVQDQMPDSAVMVQVVTPETLPDEVSKVVKGKKAK